MTHRSRRPRYVVLTLAVMALVAAIAAPATTASSPERSGGRILPHIGPERTPAVFPVPNGTIGFKSYIGWVYDDDSIAVVGEVLNNESTRRKTVSIRVTYFSSDQPGATPMGSLTDTIALDSVARGGVGPFVIWDGVARPGVGAFQVEILSSDATTTPAGGGLNLTVDPSYVDADTRFYEGVVRNPNGFAVSAVRVILTAYDSAGNVGEVMWDEPVGTIPAGSSASFIIGIADDFGANFTMSSVRFLADGFRAGQASTYVTSWVNYFDDLLGSSFRDDIAWLAQEGITYGCGPGKYCPDANVRRDEMASFLARSLDLTGTAPNAFTDDNGNTHEANINRIAAEGITTGCASGLYCPAATVRRDAMASFLARSLELTGVAPNAFTDDNGNTHEANINLVAQAGVTTGCSTGKYCPTGLVTRGQMAAFLRRAFD
jgi:hypothetical protein